MVTKTASDYHELAERRGFKWVCDALPRDAKTKTRWQCGKGHVWMSAIFGKQISDRTKGKVEVIS